MDKEIPRSTKPSLLFLMDKNQRPAVTFIGITLIILLPFIILLSVELGLRLFGYGCSPTVVIPCTKNGQEALHSNTKYGWRFYPPQVSREFPPFVFLKKKPANTRRIFVVGESAAMGDPEPAFSFWRMLDIMLRTNYPSVNFEVIPVSMVAINSFACREIVEECSRYDPDLFIVYMGNNEVIGPYGPASTLTPFLRKYRLIRLGIMFRSTRLGQLATALFAKLHPLPQGKAWTGLEMFVKNPLRLDDPRVVTVRSFFRLNLLAMKNEAVRSRSDILFCTVGGNLKDNPPFFSLHRAGLSAADSSRFDALLKEGRTLMESGAVDSALSRFIAASAIDDSYAALSFSIGQCALRKNNDSAALVAFRRARDLDGCRFRTESSLNAVVRDVATALPQSNVHFCDAEAALDAASPHGISGYENFLEHVHFTFTGNFRLACAVYRAALPVLAGAGPLIRPKEPLTEEYLRTRMAFTDWDDYQILKDMVSTRLARPPYTLQPGNDLRLSALQTEAQLLFSRFTADSLRSAVARYEMALQQAPRDLWVRWKYACLVCNGLDSPQLAEDHYRVVADSFPFFPDAFVALGYTRGRQGDLDGAIGYEQKALRYSPYNVYGLYNLGLALLLQKKYSAAEKQFAAAVDCQPLFADAYINFAAVDELQEKNKSAKSVFVRGLAVLPESEPMRLAYARFLFKQGARNQALDEIRTVLKYNAASVSAKQMLEQAAGSP